MLKSLYTRLALGLFVLLVAVGLVYTFISTVSLREYNASVNQELNRNLARDLVSDRNLVDEGRLDEKALKASKSTCWIWTAKSSPTRLIRTRSNAMPFRLSLCKSCLPMKPPIRCWGMIRAVTIAARCFP